MKTYFDTALFIYALESKDDSVRKLFAECINDGEVGTSAVTILEYAAGCLKKATKDGKESINRFRGFLNDHYFELTDIDEEVAIVAAGIRTEHPGFKSMDALQLASAVVAHADVFYTNDKQLLSYTNKKMKVIGLDGIKPE